MSKKIDLTGQRFGRLFVLGMSAPISVKNKHKSRDELRPIGEWCQIKGLTRDAVYLRLRRRWSVERALTKSQQIGTAA